MRYDAANSIQRELRSMQGHRKLIFICHVVWKLRTVLDEEVAVGVQIRILSLHLQCFQFLASSCVIWWDFSEWSPILQCWQNHNNAINCLYFQCNSMKPPCFIVWEFCSAVQIAFFHFESNTEVTIRFDSKFRIFAQHLALACALANVCVSA